MQTTTNKECTVSVLTARGFSYSETYTSYEMALWNLDQHSSWGEWSIRPASDVLSALVAWEANR